MLESKKLFLFDIDGVIKSGDVFLDGSKELCEFIDQIGGKSIFITNNSSKNVNDYVEYFKKNGFDVGKENFITALTITISYLKKHHKNDLIFAVGTKSFVEGLKENGLNVTENPETKSQVAVIGYDTELSYSKITNLCKVLQTNKSITYYATNEDLRCPVPYGFIPDCGAMVKMVEIATDKTPTFLGKPAPFMVEEALKQTGFSKEQSLVIGDRLYTDIACGINAGVDTCVVFTGEVQKEDLIATKFKPTFQFESVKEILETLKAEHK